MLNITKLQNYYRRILAIIISVIILLTFFIFGFIFNKFLIKNSIIPKQESHENGFKYISPLLECLDASAVDNKNAKTGKDIQNLINNEINEKNISFASVYVRDLNNGPWLGFNEKEKFSPASLMKVPLLISCLKFAESNPGFLKKIVVIDEKDIDPSLKQNITPLEHVEYGKSYSIDELLTYMMSYSDNVATNALLNNLDQNFLNHEYTDLGLNIPNADQENYMNVLDYATFFRILYNSTYLNREMSEKALALMTRSTFVNGLVAGVPKGVEVSHKFGERILDDTKQLHDCGIVYRKNSNYLICIMTRGNDFQKMESSIKDFSAFIYNNF